MMINEEQNMGKNGGSTCHLKILNDTLKTTTIKCETLMIK